MKAALVLLLLTGVAAAEPIQDAITAGRFADAYQLAGEEVNAHGDDPVVRYWASVACLRTARFDEAARHVDAGLVTTPADADLLGLRAQIRLFQGDEAGARASAEQAIATGQDAPDAAAALDEITIGEQARARAGGAEPALPAGSAAAFVDDLIAKIAAGAEPREIADAFDLEVLSNMPPSQRSRDMLAGAVSGALKEARRMRDQAGQQFYGWVVHPETRPSADRVMVDVDVPAESTITRRQRDALLAASEDPQLRGTVDATMLALIDGVPEAERAALLDRLEGVHTRMVMDLHFEVAGAEGDYRITDMQIGNISIKAQFGNFAKVMDKVDPPRKFHLSPKMLGTLVGAVGGLIVLVFLLTRRRR